jgi:hypothetical protein
MSAEEAAVLARAIEKMTATIRRSTDAISTLLEAITTLTEAVRSLTEAQGLSEIGKPGEPRMN